MWTAVHASAVWPQTPHPELCTTQGRPRRRSGALGCRTRVRAPGAARGGPRPAHPSRPRRPGTACSRAPRDLGCRGRAEGSRGIGKRASARGWPAAAPSPTPRRKSHLPRRAPEAAGGRVTARWGGDRAGGGGKAGSGGRQAEERDARPLGRPQPLPRCLTPGAGQPGAGHSSSVRLYQASGEKLFRQPGRGRAGAWGSGACWRVCPCAAQEAARSKRMPAPPPPARPRPLLARPAGPGRPPLPPRWRLLFPSERLREPPGPGVGSEEGEGAETRRGGEGCGEGSLWGRGTSGWAGLWPRGRGAEDLTKILVVPRLLKLG